MSETSEKEKPEDSLAQRLRDFAIVLFLALLACVLWRVGDAAISALGRFGSQASVPIKAISVPAPDSSDKVAALVKAAVAEAVAESEARIICELKEVIAQTRFVPPVQTVSSVVPAQPVEAMLTQAPTPIAPPSEPAPVVPDPDIKPSPVGLVIVGGKSEKFYLPHNLHSRRFCYDEQISQGKITLSRKAGVKADIGIPKSKSLLGRFVGLFNGNEKIVTKDIPIYPEVIVWPKDAKWVEFYWTQEGAGGNTDPLTVEVRK
jgi:Na+-transporting methylmalonyl-CoA/oxaloacetate decarboxylase gamma subunit